MQKAVADTLAERGSNYGSFDRQACIAQALKRTAEHTPGWQRMGPDQREAVHMILHKLARLLNGNPDHVDSWHDIQGYAALVEARLVDDAA